jgi:DNA-binding response OmpR family regulator
MTGALSELRKKLPDTPWGYLPPRIVALFVTGAVRTGGWLADAFASDSASEVCLDETNGMAAGLTKLRDEVFDAVLISHEPPSLDALALLDAIRAGTGEDQPVVVLGAESEQELAALCFEAGADAYVCVSTTTTRALIWIVARAIERRRLISENRRLHQARQHQLQIEHDEARRLLTQQRALVAWGADPESDTHTYHHLPLPDSLVGHYREMLRACVIMGSGNLGNEMRRLTKLLADARVTAQQALLMHLDVLEEMILGLGSRSARHVMSRADLLILDLLTNLADGYRTRLMNRLFPPRQKLLPGFDDPPLDLHRGLCPDVSSPDAR